MKISVYNHICLYMTCARRKYVQLLIFFGWCLDQFFDHTCYSTSLHVWSNMREADAGKIEPLSNQQHRESPSEQWPIQPWFWCLMRGTHLVVGTSYGWLESLSTSHRCTTPQDFVATVQVCQKISWHAVFFQTWMRFLSNRGNHLLVRTFAASFFVQVTLSF